MSGLGRYPLNIPSLSEAFSNFQHGMSSSNQRRDRLDYDDRRFRDRDRDSRRDDDFRRDSGGSRGRSSRDRFSPEPSYSSYLDDHRQGSQSNLVSYPLGHLNNSRPDRGNNRNDRNRNQGRDRYRNNNNNNSNSRSQGNRGPSNQGPGILGAKPGDRSVPELPSNPLQVPGLGVSSGGGLGSGLTAQLAQQQQQLMAMVQTQSLLAAMQAQANANAQAQVQAQARAKQVMPSSLGLLPTPLIPRTGGRDMQRQNRKRRNDGWGGGGNYGNKRERFDRNRGQQGNNRGGQNQQNRGRQGGVGAQSQQAKKTAAPDEKGSKKEEATEEERQEEEAEDGEDAQDLDVPQEQDKQDQEDGHKTPVEENRQPDLPKAVNFLGEDVDALMISLFDRKRAKYICQECKIICNLPMSFHKHLLGKRHARTVLENQGKEFDADEFKSFSQGEAPAEKLETEEVTTGTESDEREKVGDQELLSSPAGAQSPGFETNLDFVKYTCDTRKTAVKEGNIITISSVTQSRVRIDGFTSGRNMLGCEFVKAVSGFNCRLCKAFIRCGNDVISHIKGKKHQKNYQTYAQEHPQYEEHQLARNKELEAVLEPKEGEEVVLYEVLDKDIKTTASKQRSHHKDSQNEEPTEVQITKFVVAPEPTDEAAQLQINCEAADVDVSMENMEQMNDDSLLTEESFDEQQDAALLTEEEELLFDHAEHAGVEESSGNELSLSIIAPQLDETEDFIPLTVDEPVKIEEVEEPKVQLSITPRLAANKDDEKEELHESETPGSSQEEIEDTPPKENTPTSSGRRGRKGQTRGGAGRGGAARGRGRGRGSRRSARSAAGPGKAGKVKKEKVTENVDNNDDVNFMEGFEVIDEIGDGED